MISPGVFKTKKHSLFFWCPPWREQLDDSRLDWFVGPYQSERAARKDQQYFVERQANGPEVRVWAP